MTLISKQVESVTNLESGQDVHSLGVTMDEKAAKIIDRLLSWIFSREAGYLIAMGHPKQIDKIQEDLDEPWIIEAMEYLKDARNQNIPITRTNSKFIDKYLTTGANLLRENCSKIE